MILRQKRTNTRLLALHARLKVKADAKREERILLLAPHERLAFGTGVVSVQAREVDARGGDSQGFWVGLGRDGEVLWVGVAPVLEVRREGGVGGEVYVVFAV